MFETERTFLRRFTLADTDAVFGMRSDPDVMRYIRAPQTDPKEALNWIELVSSRWESHQLGFCAVVDKESGRFAGWCGLWVLRETGEIEVGYALVREFRGRGFAVEASEAFMVYGFESLGLGEIVAVTRPDNSRSRRVMERLGMTYDYTGEFYDQQLVHYSITRAEFDRRSRTEILNAPRRNHA